MEDPLSFCIVPPSTPSRPLYPTRRLLQPIPNDPDSYTLEIDYSSLSRYIECPRNGENYLIRSREADRNHSATAFGKLFHECEELRLRHGFCEAVTQRQRELVASHFLSHPCDPLDHRTAPRMLDVLSQYEKRYAHDNWHEKVVQHEGEPFIERPFKIELCTIEVNDTLPYPHDQLVVGGGKPELTKNFFVSSLHILYTGRIDAALHDSNLIFTMDNKTSSRNEGLDQFALSLQTKGYTWALQKILGQPVAGCVINSVVILPPTKTERASAPRTSFDRQTFFYPQDSLDELEENLRAHVSDFVSCLLRGYFPQTGRSFMSPCKMCEFRGNCALPVSQRSQDLSSNLYRDVTWSPIH